MKLLKTFAAVALCATSLGSWAQTSKFEFVPHWYLQANGGGQYTLGDADFEDLLSPNAQIGVGYNFNPVFGIRLSANGWQSRSGWDHSDKTYKWYYVAPQLDVTLNLSNAIAGYNPYRVFNLSLFAGGAANISFANDDANELARENMFKLERLWDGTQIRPVGRAGLGVDIRLSDVVKLNFEGSANVISDKYNSKKSSTADWYFNALMGVKVALGETYARVVEPVAYRPTPAPAPAKPETRIIEKQVVVYKEAPAEKQIDVFFRIRSAEITERENVKVDEMAEFLKKYPNVKVKVTGYADVETGNPAINLTYSQSRAKAVADALIEAGIDESRITTDAKGDTVQPYDSNDLNRVTIAVAKE